MENQKPLITPYLITTFEFSEIFEGDLKDVLTLAVGVLPVDA